MTLEKWKPAVRQKSQRRKSAWPQPSWGQVLDPFYDEKKLHLEAVLENPGIISGKPDQIRFWTSGYGFIGTSPLNAEMVLE